MAKKLSTSDERKFDLPVTVGQHLDLYTELAEKYGRDAVVDYDSGYNNISTKVVFNRELTQQEITAAQLQEARKKERKRQRRAALLEVCAKCAHGRAFHLGKSGCVGGEDGECPCQCFVRSPVR